MRTKTRCTMARLFCSGRGCFSFMRGTERRNVGVPVVPKVGPFGGTSRLDVVPGAFGISLPSSLIGRTLGYGGRTRMRRMNMR